MDTQDTNKNILRFSSCISATYSSTGAILRIEPLASEIFSKKRIELCSHLHTHN